VDCSLEKVRGKAFIVAGGPSLQGFDFSLLSNKFTIVVNKSILSVPSPNYFISVDYTFLSKIDLFSFRASPATKVFVADLSYPFLVESDGRIVDRRFDLVYDLKDYDVIVKSRKQEGMGLSFKDFRSGKNSGFCALQLAVILGFTEIYLLGVDLCCVGSTHYHEGYGESKSSFNKKLDEYYRMYVEGIQELQEKSPSTKIFSCSKVSNLNKIIVYKNLVEVVRENV